MNKEHKIHAFYILLILISIIIGIISFQWHDIPKLVELVTFALTVTSLVLAILAIAYAVYTNSSFTTNITTLNNASQELSNNAKDVSDATKELKNKMELIPSRLESMEGRFDEIKLLMQVSETQEVPVQSHAEEKASAEIAHTFIERLPVAAVVAIYSFYRVFKEKKAVNVAELFSNIQITSTYLYAFGFYIGMNAGGLVTSDSEHRDATSLKISKLDETIVNQLENNLAQIINVAVENFFKNRTSSLDKDTLTKTLYSDIATIDAYFSS